MSCSTIRVPVGPPARPVAITGRPERLEHPRDVDALAARHRGLLDRAVPAAEPEVRHRQRLVDGRVERDGDDHAAARLRADGRRRELRRRRRITSNVPATRAIATPISTSGAAARFFVCCARSAGGTCAAATSGTVATRRPVLGDVDRAQPLAAADRPRDGVRRVHGDRARRAGARGGRSARDRAARRRGRAALPPLADRHRGHRAALDHRADPLEALEREREQRASCRRRAPPR